MFDLLSPKGRQDLDLEADLEPKPDLEAGLDLKPESTFLTLLLYLELEWATPPWENQYFWRILLQSSYLAFDGPPAAALG